MTQLLEMAGQGGALVMAWEQLAQPLPRERLALRHLQSGAVRRLACRAAAQLLECNPARLSVTGGRGCPPALLRGGRPLEGICLTLSHSVGWIAAAVSRGLEAVGIDVQQMDSRPTHALGEYMGWTALLQPALGTPVESGESFTHVWTVWEAAWKCDAGRRTGARHESFAALAPGLRPGQPGAWESRSHWAMSRRLAQGCWLSLVAPGPCPDRARAAGALDG